MTKAPKITKRAKSGEKAQTRPRTKKEMPPATGKIASLVALMRRPNGATLADLEKATGWQAHSVRGAISGAIKKNLGYEVRSERIDGTRTYLIGG